MQRNSAEALPKLVGLSDYCPLLLLHMGANDTARGNLNSIRRDYRALGGGRGRIVKGMEAQAVLSVLPVKWKDMRKRALGCRTSVGNRFLGSVTMGPCLRISICLGKAGFISLNWAKTALLGGWLSRHQRCWSEIQPAQLEIPTGPIKRHEK